MTQARLPRLSARIGLALALCAALAGCDLQGTANDRVTVLGGRMVIAAPKGFCVDRASVKDGRQGSFVLFGNCAAITGDPAAPKPPYRALLSATIGPEAAGPVEATFPGFERFFRSPAGRAAIARSGSGNDVEILKVVRTPNILLLKIRDSSQAKGPPVSDVYWRAITGFEGRITALSVLPLRGAQISDSSQIRLLQTFDATIRAAQPDAAATP